MVSKQAVEEQLKRIGCNFKFWGRSEVNELGRILMEDEIIAECVNGQYSNGFAMLVATNHRVLLVDKKPLLYLTVEDVRFDMITEFNYNHRLMDATIRLFTPNKTLIFTSWNQHRLRKLLEYIQARVLEMRQQQHLAQQFTAAAAAQYAQIHAAQNPGQMNQPSFAPNLAANLPAPAAAQSAQTFKPQTEQFSAPAASETEAPESAKHESLQLPSLSKLEQGIASRFATRRAALGTYTRSKLPSIRHHAQSNAGPTAESGEVYQQGYRPKPTLNNLGMPFEYEA